MNADDVMSVKCKCGAKLEGGPPWKCPDGCNITVEHICPLVHSVDYHGQIYNILEIERFNDKLIWTFRGRILNTKHEKEEALAYAQANTLHGAQDKSTPYTNKIFDRLRKYIEDDS